jgi:hypothetical protein
MSASTRSTRGSLPIALRELRPAKQVRGAMIVARHATQPGTISGRETGRALPVAMLVIALLALIVALLNWILPRGYWPRDTQVNPSSALPTAASAENQANPAQSALGMTVSRDEIDERLKDLPTFQRDEAAGFYKGLRIQWAGELRGGSRRQNGRLVVSLTCRSSVQRMIDTEAVVANAPQVLLLHEGMRVKVVGTISGIEPGRNGSVLLDPAEISLETRQENGA